MPWGRRTTTLVMLATAAPWLVACGSDDGAEAEPPGVVIPGSTVTIGTEPVAPQTSPLIPDTSPSAPATDAPTGAELVARVGAAMGATSTVHLSVAAGTGVDQECDYDDYLGTDDFVCLVTGTAVGLEEYRKVGDTVYYRLGSADASQTYVPGQAPDGLEPVLAAALTSSLIGDLARQLTRAQDITVPTDGPGEVAGQPVETYAFTVEPQDLSATGEAPATLPTGTVDVRLSITPEGLPVQATYTYGDGQTSTGDFSGWGDPVDVGVPDLG